jgi:hypothetical protein
VEGERAEGPRLGPYFGQECTGVREEERGRGGRNARECGRKREVEGGGVHGSRGGRERERGEEDWARGARVYNVFPSAQRNAYQAQRARR